MEALDFKELFIREIDHLYKEIDAYEDESKLWKIEGQVNNSPGNLVMHLLGNINHHIGAVIGKNGYSRNRETEFSVKDISKTELLRQISDAKAMVEKVLSTADNSEFEKTSPAEFFGKRSTEYMLTYFYGHFMYHLGQISYHRRLV